jgi:hypothetical protein
VSASTVKAYTRLPAMEISAPASICEVGWSALEGQRVRVREGRRECTRDELHAATHS